jgi:hypothetical protein
MRITQRYAAERRETQAKASYRRSQAAYAAAEKRYGQLQDEMERAADEVRRTRTLRDEAQAELLRAVARVPA